MKKIITIVGARPQFIKLAATSAPIRKYFQEVIVHTGQHYDYEMSRSFFEELNIPDPNYNLEVGSDKPLKQIAKMLIGLEEIIEKEKPDCFMVFGDTNSTAAGAIAAAKYCVPLVHVEAGMREFNKTIPEEINKLITSALTDIHFCATHTAVKNLADMGIRDHVYMVGDVMIDHLFRLGKQLKENTSILEEYGVRSGQYVFATLHRASNTENPERLKGIMHALAQMPMDVVLPLHPRTHAFIEKYGFQDLLKPTNIKVIKPIPFFPTQVLVSHARCVITDSGGLTKETYFHGVQGIITEDQTEWLETLNHGWNTLTGANTEKILATFNQWQRPSEHAAVLGDGRASEHLAEILNKVIQGQLK